MFFNDNSANVLDLKIYIEDGNFNVNLFDKREVFPFEIVKFSDKSSNVSRHTVLGVFKSQVVRYSRICSDFNNFIERLQMIVRKFVELGFGKKLLGSQYFVIAKKHNFVAKWKTEYANFITMSAAVFNQ